MILPAASVSALLRLCFLDNWSIVPWPAGMPAEDDCADAELVRGHVPPRLRFGPAEWVELRLIP